MPTVVERLLAHTIACQPEGLLVPVPQREGEHSYCLLDSGLDSPNGEACENRLCIRMPAPLMHPRGLELLSEFQMVVNFSIEDQNVSAG